MFPHLAHWLADDAPDEMVLYHYTKADILELILQGHSIMFSPYSRMNDPRESKEWIAEVLLAAGGVSAKTLAAANAVGRRADALLRRGARLACFTLDRTAGADVPADVLFHKGWARANMWAQYADCHAGACLAFDRPGLVEQADTNRPVEDGNVFTCGRVVYADAPLSIPIDMTDVRTRGIDAVLDDFQVRRGVAGQLYLTKNTDWASEQEFRIVMVRWNLPEPEWDVPVFVPIGSALRAVVLGEAFPDADIPRVRDLLRSWPDVDLVRCKWERGAPVLSAA